MVGIISIKSVYIKVQNQIFTQFYHTVKLTTKSPMQQQVMTNITLSFDMKINLEILDHVIMCA